MDTSTCFFISADPLALGVSESMVHPVPPNSHNAPTAQILRFSDSQILRFVRFLRFFRYSRFSRFSERLIELDYL